MSPPFLLLLGAAAIFRYLSADANKAFKARLASLLPRSVVQEHLRVLAREYPDRLGEFRRRVVPWHGLHVLLNAAACGCFIPALWFFPPSGLDDLALGFLRYGSLLLAPVAFLMDIYTLTRMIMATFGSDAEAGGAL
jgi:hypothetical protein